MGKVNRAWSHLVPLPLCPPAIHSILYVPGIAAVRGGKPSRLFAPHGRDAPPESPYLKAELQSEQQTQLWGQ